MNEPDNNSVTESAPYLEVVKVVHPDVDEVVYQVAPAHARDIAVDTIADKVNGDVDPSEIEIEQTRIESADVVEIAKEHLAKD